ncbi:hypothetical protein [Ulvibacter antarcticus]|uniref:LPXTG-motif cell wall-anchored protein n=1 Tax=Ulvibacter antarcticus TaxID=442714 RepID=A0A3L9Z7Q2_9FLAO|nr:hypothetical protein [Ulvibacter antarcticus]RMA66478.1 hypothetical protein BXY75_0904 [Ulvibacter antarcticus]
MANNIYKLFEYAYLAMAAFSVYIVYENWSDNRNRAYLFAFFGVVAIFMFFFKRNFRRKMDERNKK